MRARGSGIIVNLMSEIAIEDAQNKAAFIATMDGLAGFTRQADRELSRYGIRVHSVMNSSETIVGAVFALLQRQTEEG